MGSGKTYWGKIWAKTMQMNFIDLDAEIEAIEGKSVAQILKRRAKIISGKKSLKFYGN
ncbi:MAG: hypothetical protein IPP48_02965 [Chitinophagaceae bacterium]|nr:hypothetical protein [Chitinophagaceae bacterium]